MKKGFCFFVFLFSCSVACAQFTIQGTVTNVQTGESLPGINVFISNTTIGTSTNAEGDYKLNNVDSGLYEIVFSAIGFEKKVKALELKILSSPINLNIELQPIVYKLNEIEVVSTNREWKINYGIFEKEFLGRTDFARKTAITNPWVLDFKKDKHNTLIATAEEPLILINKALGYRMYIELVKFIWSKSHNKSTYITYSKYEPLTPQGDIQEKIWSRNRIKTYLGSFPHFLKSLYHAQLKKSSFSLRWLSDISQLQPGETRFKLFERGIPMSMFEQYKGYKLDDKIRISYNETYRYMVDGKQISLPVRKKSSVAPDTPEETFFVKENGILLDPASLQVFGHWAKTRMADSLPANYQLEQ